MKKISIAIVLVIIVFIAVFTFLDDYDTKESLNFLENINATDTAIITFDVSKEVINYSDRDRIDNLFNKLDASIVLSKKYNKEIEENILKLYCTIEAFQQNEMMGTIEIYQVKNEVIIDSEIKISSSIDEIECVVKINKKFWILKNNNINFKKD